MVRLSTRALVVLACCLPVSLAAAEDALPQSARRVLETHCIGCHGATRMSGLDMRTSETLLAGGTRGSAVIPHDASASLLVQAVQGQGPISMPPGDKPLSDKEVDILTRWIDAGAQWDDRGAEIGDATWWSFRKPERPRIPDTGASDWIRTPIDAFVLAALRERGLDPAAPADPAKLVRRAYFDLHGLPPPPEEVEKFARDPSEAAYRALIDRLLESKRYGERWGRYWLDLVRYADTSGFETDHFYTTAWRYRDYVIESFNDDKPYTTFVQEQIAADELWPTDMDLEGTLELPPDKRENIYRRIGTSLFTLGAFPIEYTYYGDLYRAEWRAEAVDTIGAAFLGLTLECARCHDHKSDPFSQRDYYRLAAFFAGSVEGEVPLVSLFDVQTSTRAFPLLEQARILKRMAKRMGGDTPPDQRRKMLERLGEAYLKAPEPYASAKVLVHAASVPESYVLAHGDFRRKGERVEPGFPAAIPVRGAVEEPAGRALRRRASLARWLTAPDHPLLGRVMVNRIWQHHFGRGLVASPNDFGRHGDRPSQPDLLDWLAVEFAARGWSLKEMHRLLMLSSVYRSSSLATRAHLDTDPENRLLARMSRRRLDADAIRDAILAVSGRLNLRMGGVGVIPSLTAAEILAARTPRMWPANPDPAERDRRSVYLQSKRSMAVPMLQVFDAPDTARSCARRETSTVAPQALAMMNSGFVLGQAAAFADRIRELVGEDPGKQVEVAWRLALGRVPAAAERPTAIGYLERNSLAEFCLMLFNMNEFVYVD